MKKITKLLTLLLLGLPITITSCSGSGSEDISVEYNFVYDRPFYSTPDDFMKIDGKFDEEQWSDCKWMVSTQFGVTIKVTTFFTKKGLYLAAYAKDKDIRHNGRNNFINNSGFELQIVKEDEPVYDAQARWTQHKMRDYLFEVDALTCRSYRERNFAGAIDFEGVVNSGDTDHLGFEMFMGWDQMDYLPSELNENGFPKNGVRVWSRYNVQTLDGVRYFSPFLMDYGRYNTYYNYGPKGIINYCDNGILGSAINGTTATDRWDMHQDGTISCVSDQTNHIWFKKDAYGGELSKPVSFIADATVKVDTLTEGSNPYFGIMTIHDMNNMVTYGANLRELNNEKAFLIAFEGTDGNTWVGQSTWNKNIPLVTFPDKTLSLRLIKIGGYYYYFYKNPSLVNDTYHFVDMQYYDKNDSDVDVGLFANGKCTFTNYQIIDCTNNEEFANAELSKSLYFINTKSSSGGDVSIDKTRVAKGESVKILCVPSKGYVLNDLTINGEDYFDDYISNTGDYLFTPDKDVEIKATFKKIPTDLCQTITYIASDEYGNPVVGAEFEISSLLPLFYQSGVTNGKGILTAVLPKAGSFDIEGRHYDCDGNYTISISKNAYLPFDDSFILTEDIEKEVLIKKSLWGQIININGKGVSDAYGSLHYDEAGDYYYALTGARQYYTDQISTSGEYVSKVKINTSRLGNELINPVVGITLSSGADNSINIKSAWWETNNICIEVNGKEVSVSGFKHNLSNNASDSFIDITVARYNNALYLYDYTGELCLSIDSKGIHPNGNRNFVNKTALGTVNEYIKKFFDNGKENVLGPLAIDPANGKVDYHFDPLQEEDVELFVTGGTITIDTQNKFEYTCDKGDVSNYKKGETVKLEVTSNDKNKIISKLKLSSSGGDSYINGNYDVIKGTTSFSFVHDKGDVTITPCEELNLRTVFGTVTASGKNLSKTSLTLEGTVNGVFNSLVNSEGAYSFKAPEGELEMMFINDGSVGFIDKFIVSSNVNKDVTLVSNTNLVGDATINGIGISSKATLDITTVKGFVDENPTNIKSSIYSREFGNKERREYFLAVTSSPTVNDFTCVNTMSSTSAYGYVGLGITDGGNLLICQLGTGDRSGKFTIKFGSYNNKDEAFDLKQLVYEGDQTAITGSSFDNVELKAVKEGNKITFYANDTLLYVVDNSKLDSDIEFFKDNKQYCVGYASSNVAGIISNFITIE